MKVTGMRGITACRETHNRRPGFPKILLTLILLSIFTPAVCTRAQAPESAPVSGPDAAPASAATAPTLPQTDPPLTLTLQDALARAQKNNPEFRAALTALGIAHEDRVQARAAFLPTVNYNNQFIYTEGNGTPGARFVANNGVHEYLSQANVHEDFLNPARVADYRRTNAAEALARARQEIAARGLVLTVVQTYYALVTAQRKYSIAQHGITEAQNFLGITDKLEHGGEVAHSDVIKAQLQFNQRQRDFQEAQLEMERDRLKLAVLMFPNFNQNFSVVDDLQTPASLPALPEIQALAARNNPQLRVALASLQAAREDLLGARAAYLPTVALDYFYGIDANHFATKTDGIRNLGYSASATLVIPVWNWGATHSKVKQADLRRQQAEVELSAAQRELLADLQSFYDEADTARSELATLARSAELAQESLRLTTLRYQAGESTVLEIADAQNTLIQTRNAYDDAQVRYRVSLVNLQTLTGIF
jgi:outer membrane protein TolC